jgi:hypothetical protein
MPGMISPYFYPSHRQKMGDPQQALDLMLTIYFDGANFQKKVRRTIA